MASANRVLNFSAGPAKLPLEVLERVSADLLNWNGTGMSVMEMSHRGKHFKTIIDEAEEDLRSLMNIPDNYKVLFMQGGGTGQFAAIPLNLVSVADYIVTGGWSAKAEAEARKFCQTNIVNPKIDGYTDPSTFQFSDDAEYIYYCDNETVFGVEFPEIPSVPEGAKLVCDMSSNFLTREVDVSKFALIYAGAQKNAGPAGLTIVIVRDDLLGKGQAVCPTILNYKIMADAGSMPNTPPCWSIYVTGQVFKWIRENGRISAFQSCCATKSALVYDVIDNSSGFYKCPVAEHVRSRINIPFRICRGGHPDKELEETFLKEAEAEHMFSLKGHRSVGGLRASLYNATTLEDTQVLTGFMLAFARKNSGDA